MKITEYNLQTQKPNIDLKIAVVADLHSKEPSPVIAALEQIHPDVILCAGDIFECFEDKNSQINQNGFMFFEQSVKIAPTYYCLGNHEIEGKPHEGYPEIAGYKSIPTRILEQLEGLGVHTVFDSYNLLNDNIAIGGLISGSHKNDGRPNIHFVESFSKLSQYKILICHHPEYYPIYLADKDIDMILSGHAHGGQWSFFGRGLYAPSQGFFPKYTSGIHDGRLIISRGCSNSTRPIKIPRLLNPTEVLSIHVRSI